MRVALVYEEFRLDRSLARDRVLVARELTRLGIEVHVYADPTQRLTEPPGIVFHDVSTPLRAPTRFGRALEYGSFAAAATRRLREDRAMYDVIDVAGTTAWEHDVVRVHAVQAAERRRWPSRGGRGYRLAQLRAAMIPLTQPRLGAAQAIERLQYRPGRFKRVFAVTEGVKHDLEQVRGVDPSLVQVVGYPVETERFAAATPGVVRRRLGISPDHAVALFVGHDYERKGLAEGITGVAKSGRDVNLVVVGEGDAAPLARQAAELGVAARVHFVGGTETPEEYFADADVFVLPTREDVWAVSVIEAMAAGVPVIVSDVAGAAELVRQHDAGVVIDGSAVDVARALTVVRENREEARRMGERGRVAASAFDVTRIAGEIADAYTSIANGNRARAS